MFAPLLLLLLLLPLSVCGMGAIGIIGDVAAGHVTAHDEYADAMKQYDAYAESEGLVFSRQTANGSDYDSVPFVLPPGPSQLAVVLKRGQVPSTGRNYTCHIMKLNNPESLDVVVGARGCRNATTVTDLAVQHRCDFATDTASPLLPAGAAAPGGACRGNLIAEDVVEGRDPAGTVRSAYFGISRKHEYLFGYLDAKMAASEAQLQQTLGGATTLVAGTAWLVRRSRSFLDVSGIAEGIDPATARLRVARTALAVDGAGDILLVACHGPSPPVPASSSQGSGASAAIDGGAAPSPSPSPSPSASLHMLGGVDLEEMTEVLLSLGAQQAIALGSGIDSAAAWDGHLLRHTPETTGARAAMCVRQDPKAAVLAARQAASSFGPAGSQAASAAAGGAGGAAGAAGTAASGARFAHAQATTKPLPPALQTASPMDTIAASMFDATPAPQTSLSSSASSAVAGSATPPMQPAPTTTAAPPTLDWFSNRRLWDPHITKDKLDKLAVAKSSGGALKDGTIARALRGKSGGGKGGGEDTPAQLDTLFAAAGSESEASRARRDDMPMFTRSGAARASPTIALGDIKLAGGEGSGSGNSNSDGKTVAAVLAKGANTNKADCAFFAVAC